MLPIQESNPSKGEGVHHRAAEITENAEREAKRGALGTAANREILGIRE